MPYVVGSIVSENGYLQHKPLQNDPPTCFRKPGDYISSYLILISN